MNVRASKLLFVCICTALVGYEAYRFYDTTVLHAPTVMIEGEQRIQISAFGDGAQVTQAFGMTADGLRGVSVQLSTDRPATLVVLCELQERFEDMPGAYADVYRWTTTVNDVSGTQWRHFNFPPLNASAGRFYAFSLRVLASDSKQGQRAGDRLVQAAERPRVTLTGFSDNVRRGGILWLDGTRQVGSVFFQAHGDGETAYARFRLGVEPLLPRPLRNLATQAALMLILNWALLASCHAMLFVDPERRE